MKVILVSFLLFGVIWADLSCECGRRNAGRIIGGKVAKKNEYPWVVALVKTADDFAFCGGTIITQWHVLTAAHCVRRPKTDLYLVVGAHDVNDFTDRSRQHLLIDQIILHHDAASDLALIVTANEIRYNKFVGPACMPDGMTGDELNYAIVKAIGWGRYKANMPNTDRIKKLREVDVETRKDCLECIGFTGDSGGPLVWLNPDTNRFTLVGVISSGPTDCGNSISPQLNVYVIHYLDWINEMIGRSVSSARTCYKI